jgi:hypothetical protein
VPSKGTEPAILLPRGRARGVPPSLKVWLSNPPPRETPPADDRDYGGSYLYLVEAADQAPFGQVRTYEGRKLFVTGCSALRRVMEHARTKEELSAEEAYRNGRGDPAHPLEKLAALGAHSSLPREIEVLYQMRWMSDEQGDGPFRTAESTTSWDTRSPFSSEPCNPPRKFQPTRHWRWGRPL